MTKAQNRPIVGIICRRDGFRTLPESLRYNVLQEYVRAVSSFGVAVILIPPHGQDCLLSILAFVDGILLAGGGDLDPASYREKSLPVTGCVDPKRDSAELFIAREAIKRDMPLLGICRGLHVINVALGGTICQDIDTLVPNPVRHMCNWRQGERFVHPVRLSPGSKLVLLASGKSLVLVNGSHHQCVQNIADGLIVSAVAPDGVVEALEDPNRRFVLAVQWHPECLLEHDDELSKNIISGFIDAVRAFSTLKSSFRAM